MTIKEIAEKAGVSVATVSYVIHNTGNVSQKTREKINKIIQDEGYVPNKIAQGLRASKSKTIGVLVEDITAFQTPRIINGINEYMESNDFHILLSDLGMIQKVSGRFDDICNYKREINNSLKLFEAAQVDGIIYVALHDRNISGLFKTTNTPVIYAYCYDAENRTPYITYDNYHITKNAIRYFIELGHEKIGIIWGEKNSRPANLRYQGFIDCLNENKIYLPKEYVLNREDGDWEYDSGYRAYDCYKEIQDKPTALFAMNDLIAMGFIKAAVKDGLSLPKDVSVIGFDNREGSFFCSPSLTTIDIPLERLGYETGKALLKIINKQAMNSYTLTCQLIKRESVMLCKKQ